MKYILTTSILLLSLITSGQPFLGIPLEGQAKKDWIIVNYVDWSIDSIHDHKCNSKAYNGHEGTDFTLRSFRQMDSGVYVLAAANGRVTFRKDGEFDREKESVIAKGLGNYIAIRHPNKYYSYYGHLKKNSLLINEGDSVTIGQRIAKVASSGNSTDPHLHFELWYDSLYVVDPFTGPCGNNTSLWLKEPKYDTSFGIFESGLHRDTLSLNELRERNTSFHIQNIVDVEDSIVSLWSHMYGMKKGDSLKVKWFDSNAKLVFTYDYAMLQDWWYYYFWTQLNLKGLAKGSYNVQLERNGNQILSDTFHLGRVIGIKEITNQNKCNSETVHAVISDSYNGNGIITLYDSKGSNLSHLLNKSNFAQLPRGIYYLQIKTNQEVCYDKIKI